MRILLRRRRAPQTTCVVFRALMLSEEHLVLFKDPATARDVTLADKAFAYIREQAR